MADDIFTDEDFAQSERYNGGLKPSYFAARRVVQNAMKDFDDEALAPLVKTCMDALQEKLWDSVKYHLWSDAELNLQSQMEGMVERTVQALLTGERWALNAYPLSARYDADKIREAVAKHIPQELQDARIADLEAKLARVEEDFRRHREWERP